MKINNGLATIKITHHVDYCELIRATQELLNENNKESEITRDDIASRLKEMLRDNGINWYRYFDGEVSQLAKDIMHVQFPEFIGQEDLSV